MLLPIAPPAGGAEAGEDGTGLVTAAVSVCVAEADAASFAGVVAVVFAGDDDALGALATIGGVAGVEA
ncbi:hypothetical protein [Paraburkholderia adhaesiva]|uniref:hypothetical protein n=1 Tax=Paraburkholderia adhaesiva TaxID=2883244 RepID=UPI001F2EF74A|nr:hypothetical protein [Paraburkholderia adhaesiva]